MNTHAQRRQNRKLRRLRLRQRERQRRQERQKHQSCQSAPSPFAVGAAAAAAAATPLAKAHTPAQLLSQAKLLQSIAKIVEKQTVRMSREEAKMRAKKGT